MEMQIIYMLGRAMSQKLPVKNFNWIKETSQFNEDFIKNYKEEITEEYFFEVDFHYLEKLYAFNNYLPVSPERKKI